MTAPERILVVRTDRVGDLILSTPFLRTLRTQFPKSEIVLRTAPYCREVLAGTGLCDRIVDEELGPGERFDLAVALAPRTACLKEVGRAKAPRRVGYVYRNRPLVRLLARFYLTDVVELNVDTRSTVSHEVEQLDKLGRAIGIPPTTYLPLEVGVARRERESTDDGDLVLHLGDRWLQSNWSAEDLLQVVDRLSGFGHVILTGGPREREMMARLSAVRPSLKVLCDLSFREWAETIAQAKVLVSPDTGAVHVAAAVGTPVVVAYEAQTFQHCSSQWAPWKVAYRAVVKGEPSQTGIDLVHAVEELTFDSRNCPL